MIIQLNYNIAEALGGIGFIGILTGFSMGGLALIHMKHIENFKRWPYALAALMISGYCIVRFIVIMSEW